MLMIDLEILRNTNGEESLHSVMRELYHQFARKSRGYSEEDFRSICVKYGGGRVNDIFDNHMSFHYTNFIFFNS